MPLSDQETVESVAMPPPARDPAQDLLGRWGLRAGRSLAGWTIDSVGLADNGDDAACAQFSRGSASVVVTFRAGGTKPRFARVGGIDVAHYEIDPEHSAEAGKLLKLIVAWLKRRDDITGLARVLQTIPPPVLEQTEPGATAQSSAEEAVAMEGQPYLVVHEAPPLDPAKRAPAERPVLGFEFIDVADLHKYPDALREMFNGTRGGLVIRGVYSKEEMAQVVSRLDASQDRFPQMQLPASQKTHFLGRCLEGGDPSLQDYLDSASRFREETLPVFEGMQAFEPRVESVFRSLSGGRPVQLARFGDGRSYTPATIRIVPVDGQLAPHCGNEMYQRPAYGHLKSMVDNKDQISYFLTLQEAEEGGGLIIYSLKWSDVGPENILPDNRSNVGALLGDAEWMEVRPSTGDVLIFDGGRYLHRVDWVKGSRTRWTMGGFLMFDKAGKNVLYFA